MFFVYFYVWLYVLYFLSCKWSRFKKHLRFTCPTELYDGALLGASVSPPLYEMCPSVLALWGLTTAPVVIVIRSLEECWWLSRINRFSLLTSTCLNLSVYKLLGYGFGKFSCFLPRASQHRCQQVWQCSLNWRLGIRASVSLILILEQNSFCLWQFAKYDYCAVSRGKVSSDLTGV